MMANGQRIIDGLSEALAHAKGQGTVNAAKLDRVARAILHEAHVGRFRGSPDPHARKLAAMTPEQVWQACNDGQREFATMAARVAAREFGA